MAIETKVEGKNPTPRQYETMRQITRAGGVVFVIHNQREIDLMVALFEALPCL